MIKLYNQVPTIYNNASRDFQYLSRLFNIVLNSVKHNVDDLYHLPTAGANAKIAELLAMTLGFKVKRNYDQEQLTALATILPTVLRYKGTKKAIQMAADALIMASGALGAAKVEMDGYELRVILPKDLIDIALFIDLLDYILPAGITCRIDRQDITPDGVDRIELLFRDSVVSFITDDFGHTGTGLSNLYTVQNANALLGQAISSTDTNAGLASIGVTDSENKITLLSQPSWSIEKVGGGVRLKSSGGYLAHDTMVYEDGTVIPYVKIVQAVSSATVWSITPHPGVSGACLITVNSSGDTKYCLAYNRISQQFCTSAYGQDYDNIFDLFLYKEMSVSSDVPSPVCSYELIKTGTEPADDNAGSFGSLTEEDKFIIVARGTPDFTSNIKRFGDSLLPNIGLMSNTIIPALLDAKASLDYPVLPENPDYLTLHSTELDGSHKLLISRDGLRLMAKAGPNFEDGDYLYSTELNGEHKLLISKDFLRLKAKAYTQPEDDSCYLYSTELDGGEYQLMSADDLMLVVEKNVDGTGDDYVYLYSTNFASSTEANTENGE